MGFGPVSFASVQSVDSQAPGAPLFGEFTQLDNHTWSVPMTLPTTDSNGDEISKLTKLAFATASTFDHGLSMDSILAIPDIHKQVIELDPVNNLPGSTVVIEFPITVLGDAQEVCGACSDQ